MYQGRNPLTLSPKWGRFRDPLPPVRDQTFGSLVELLLSVQSWASAADLVHWIVASKEGFLFCTGDYLK
ncbi:hypothetical protein RHGRI_034805 [Rhododendron griersonianum]|uniref:Uncharacterized protein n=1 Tax=Rhododendron griersonianum TaxID=479676 RepID=A0AAV6I6M7_9ERIC|nr:hypothetical protein RHGRI_034805 [Rhododendron griersonianum]